MNEKIYAVMSCCGVTGFAFNGPMTLEAARAFVAEDETAFILKLQPVDQFGNDIEHCLRKENAWPADQAGKGCSRV